MTKSTTIKKYTKKNNETYYMFQVYCGINQLTGKDQYTTRRGFKTKKEATLALAKIKLAIENGTLKKKQVETFKDIYDLWIELYEKTVEESTYVKTIGIFRNHILPKIGLYKIDKITIEVCQKLLNNWAIELKNFRMVKAYATKIFAFALKRGYIERNPFTLVEIPNKKGLRENHPTTKSENFYTSEQLNYLLNCFEKEQNFKAFVLFRLLSYSGMRKGEALSLQWIDLDFESNEILVNKAISRGKENKIYVKSTKTDTVRLLKMDNKTMSILNQWKKQQKIELLQLGFSTLSSSQLVFSNEQNNFIQPTKTRKWLEHVLKKYDLPKITTHGLRHSHCSILFEAGVGIKEVQDRLGHSDVQTTLNIYAHVSENAKDQAINKFESFMRI